MRRDCSGVWVEVGCYNVYIDKEVLEQFLQDGGRLKELLELQKEAWKRRVRDAESLEEAAWAEEQVREIDEALDILREVKSWL